jgi:hypothetical protein
MRSDPPGGIPEPHPRLQATVAVIALLFLLAPDQATLVLHFFNSLGQREMILQHRHNFPDRFTSISDNYLLTLHYLFQ